VRAIKALFLIAGLIWIGKLVADSVEAVQRGDLVLHVRPGWLALSGVLVLSGYAILIRAWLYILEGLSGQRLRFLDGAAIWFISNLGSMLPGRVWGILQMGAMSAERGINPIAAGAASVINATVNIASGMAVGVIAGTGIFAAYLGDASLAWMVTALAIAGVLLLPAIVPVAFRFASRRFGAAVPQESPPRRLIAVSAMANVVAWFLYGAAFLCLVRGVVNPDATSVIEHTAVNATSYVIGYMAIFSPAGLVVREETMQQVLLIAGMATPAQATAISVISRLWLLIIQVLPALIFLAYRRPPADQKDR
jgi:hypothetical protein